MKNIDFDMIAKLLLRDTPANRRSDFTAFENIMVRLKMSLSFLLL